MLWGRLVILSLLALWVAVTLPFERSSIYLLVVVVFAVLGVIPFVLVRIGHGGSWTIAAFLFLDASLLSYLVIGPNPYGIEGWSPQMNLRAPGFLYVGLFLVYMSLSYKPTLVVWAGIAAVLSWSVGYWWVISLPETRFFTSEDVLDAGLSLESALREVLDPNAVGLARWVNQAFFLVAVTLILTIAVWRSRQLVFRQVAAEGQRLLLSRYFSPNIVQELSKDSTSLDRPKVLPVAVLFADMVGFTAISERMKPDALLELLRDFHGRLARTAIAHGGTVDKYIGDAIMVHFGTPNTRHDDAIRALKCAADMISEIEEMNTTRSASASGAVRIGIGIHYGDVIVGNIGDQARLEYTVLGDTVNVASRLEAATRNLGACLVVSDAVVEAARKSGSDPNHLLPDLHSADPINIRGRAGPVDVWIYETASLER